MFTPLIMIFHLWFCTLKKVSCTYKSTTLEEKNYKFAFENSFVFLTTHAQKLGLIGLRWEPQISLRRDWLSDYSTVHNVQTMQEDLSSLTNDRP